MGSWLALGRFNQVFDIDGACRVPAPVRRLSRTGADRMEKVVILLWGDGAAGSGDALRDRLLGETVAPPAGRAGSGA